MQRAVPCERVQTRHEPTQNFIGRCMGFCPLLFQRLSLRVGHFENELSGVLTPEELQQRVGKCFEALYDVLARFEFAGSHPPGHFAGGLRITIGVVKHDHTFHTGAIDEKRKVVGGSFDRRGIAVLRDRAADDHSRAARAA